MQEISNCNYKHAISVVLEFFCHLTLVSKGGGLEPIPRDTEGGLYFVIYAGASFTASVTRDQSLGNSHLLTACKQN